MRRRDVFCLLPIWTFFAPRPGTTDTRLLWREAFGGGHVGPWHELSPPQWSPWRAVWNPDRRTQKAITDAGGLLAQDRGVSETTILTIPYLMLLSYVASQRGSPHAVARQFIVVQTAGEAPAFDDVEPVALSRWHAVVSAEPSIHAVAEERCCA